MVDPSLLTLKEILVIVVVVPLKEIPFLSGWIPKKYHVWDT
jgi:hypothetical protein